MTWALALALLSAPIVACQIVAGIDERSIGRTAEDSGVVANDGGSTSSGSRDSGAAAAPGASCARRGSGTSTCGPAASDDCCASSGVPGGTFDRAPGAATVSAFRLDRFEVTVGRFRAFVDAVIGGWRPAAGSGKHAHVAGGAGLAATTGGSERGWDAAWTTNLASTRSAWTAALSCASSATWTAAPDANGASESLPIDCVTWFEAYAFCIWDGGFLPSEAEWAFSAMGGSEARKYPWSVPSDAEKIDCTFANYGSCYGRLAPVGAEPNGAGKWGHLGLAGNVAEWTLDAFADYTSPCVDCADVADGPKRADRGGSFHNTAQGVYAATRDSYAPTQRGVEQGIRCARSP